MTYTERRAERSKAKPLIGFHCQSGGGKTYGALMLARSFVGPTGKITMVETEEGRGEAYADATEYPEIGGYQVVSMGAAGFSPDEYIKAIDVAEAGKPDALILDSASHEWEGRGGVIEWAAELESKGKKGMQVWKDPKMAHSSFMLRIMQSPVPLVILNMRSRYPMEQLKEARGNAKKGDWVRAEHLEPKQSEDILFEMFLHGWFERDTHKFHIGKCTNKGLLDVFREGELFTPDTGKRLKAWSEKRAGEIRSGSAPVTADDTPSGGLEFTHIAGMDKEGKPRVLKVQDIDLWVDDVLVTVRKAQSANMPRFLEVNEAKFAELEAAGHTEAVAKVRAAISEKQQAI